MGGRLAGWINAVNDKGPRLDPSSLKWKMEKKKTRLKETR